MPGGALLLATLTLAPKPLHQHGRVRERLRPVDQGVESLVVPRGGEPEALQDRGLLVVGGRPPGRLEIEQLGIDFAEARSAFADEQAKIILDPDHSEDEDRFILIGLSLHLRLLVVCHCYREQNNSIRIISARKATKPESRQY